MFIIIIRITSSSIKAHLITSSRNYIKINSKAFVYDCYLLSIIR